MQLRTARLCLDCEEVHTDHQCPICASESFAYLTRWVPVSDRRQTRRTSSTSAAAPASAPATTRPNSSIRWARRGAAGVALVAVSQWLWRNTRPVEWSESDRPQEPDATADRPTRPVR